MLKLFLFVLSSLVLLPLYSSEADKKAQELHDRERSPDMDPSKIVLRGDTPEGKYSYKAGETIPFTITLNFGDQFVPSENYYVSIRRFGEDKVNKVDVFPIFHNKPLIYKTSSTQPGFINVKVTLLDSNKKPVLVDKRPLAFIGGMGVELDKVTPEPEPADFDEFWQKQLDKINAIPMDVKMVKVKSPKAGFDLYKFSVPCGADMPATGFISIPSNSGNKKFKAIVTFLGYGRVYSVWKVFNEDAISMSVSRFGAEPDMDKEYYEAISKRIGLYGMRGNYSREKSYFMNIIRRNIRSVQLLKTLPAWDGKNLILTGASMGGMQALWVAGMDHDVSEVNIGCPWLCDVKFKYQGRGTSLHFPGYTPPLEYFDAVNFAKRIKSNCRVTIDTGFGDPCCPVGGVYRAFANIPGKNKKLLLRQAATHARAHKNPQIFTL